MDIDLNLLRVFDMLMEYRSVTRAAQRLGVTQSAVSHALGRLRSALNDPLFLRGADGFQPTSRALEIAVGVRDGLSRLTQSLVADHVEPRRRFVVAASTYFCALLIPQLVEEARRTTFGLSLRVVPVGDQLVRALDSGSVDLVFGVFERVPSRFVVEPLFDEEPVWIAAPGTPRTRRPFDSRQVEAHERVIIAARMPFDPPETVIGDDMLVSAHWATDATLTEAITVYDAQTAIAIVAASDMIALVPRRVAQKAGDQVTVLGPGGLQRVTLSMLWHTRQRAEAGLIRLREAVRTAVAIAAA